MFVKLPKSIRLNRKSAVVTLAGVVAAMTLPIAARAEGTTYTWVVNSSSDLWGDGMNWSTGIPPAGTDTDVLVFGGSGSTGYLSYNDLGNPQTLNQLVLQNNSSAAATLFGVGLSFHGNSPQIVQLGVRSRAVEFRRHRLRLFRRQSGAHALRQRHRRGHVQLSDNRLEQYGIARTHQDRQQHLRFRRQQLFHGAGAHRRGHPHRQHPEHHLRRR